jgi:hypothetical protein
MQTSLDNARFLQNTKTFLQGKRTFITAIVAALYILGYWLEFWDLREDVLAIFGAGGLFFLRSAIKRGLPVALLLFAGVVMVGCSSLSNSVFRAEQLAAQTSLTAVQSYNIYYRHATNGASLADLAQLNRQRDHVWDLSRQLAASLSVLEATRLAYTTNAATQPQLTATLLSVQSQSSNLVWLVTYLRTPKSH